MSVCFFSFSQTMYFLFLAFEPFCDDQYTLIEQSFKVRARKIANGMVTWAS